MKILVQEGERQYNKLDIRQGDEFKHLNFIKYDETQQPYTTYKNTEDCQ